MSQVIIYQNPNGTNVFVSISTGELPIEEVLTRDCPPGAIIVDDSTLPQGANAEFFDAWELNGSTITVNIEKAKEHRLKYYNAKALQVAQKRQLNTLAGLPNDISDDEFMAKLIADREAISQATTTEQLVAIADLA